MASPGVTPNLSGSYEIISLLGTGGMGSVFKARQLSTGRIVALKTLQDSGSPNAVRRFQREAKMLATLKHPNIVEAWTFGLTEDRQAYLTMEYLEGVSLAEVLKRDGPLPLERFLKLFSQVISGLKHAHQHGVIHRDLKPDNIMLITTPDGGESVKLVDFGIARLEKLSSTPNKLTKNGALIGTLNYMSPEQFKGGALDARSDIYSLGCVMHEALIGTPPYQISAPVEAMVHSADTAEFVPNLVPHGVPAWLNRMIEICLSREPKFRYQTTALLEADFTAKLLSPTSEKNARTKDLSRAKPGSVVPLAVFVLLAAIVAAAFAFPMVKLTRSSAPIEQVIPSELPWHIRKAFRQGNADLNSKKPRDAMTHFDAAELLIAHSKNAPIEILEIIATEEKKAARHCVKLHRYGIAFELYKRSHAQFMKCSRLNHAAQMAAEASVLILDWVKTPTDQMYQSALEMCQSMEGERFSPDTATLLRVNRNRLLAKLGLKHSQSSLADEKETAVRVLTKIEAAQPEKVEARALLNSIRGTVVKPE